MSSSYAFWSIWPWRTKNLKPCFISTVPHPACRFQFFLEKVLPQYRDSAMSHTLIYIPSYFDYIRLRNYMKKEEINFASICEYSSKSEVSRARHFFQKGDKHFVLFTERFHFYKRSVRFIAPSGSPTCVGLCVWFEGDFVFSPSSWSIRVSQLVKLCSSSRVFRFCWKTLKITEYDEHPLNPSHAINSKRFKDNNLYYLFKS